MPELPASPAGTDPAYMSGLELMQEAAAGRIPAPPAAALLGAKVLEARRGFARIRFEAREEFYNPQGNVQGGLLAAMLDDAMGPAALTLLDAMTFAPTLEMKVNYLRSAQAGALIAEGNVVHQTRRHIRVEGKLTTEDGQLIATSSATLAVIEPREGDPS